jgi:hypothetical protein
MELEDWTAAVKVFDAFRGTFPDHKLQLEARKQIAYAYRQNGDLSLAAGEYERISSQSTDRRCAARRCSLQVNSTSNPMPGIARWLPTPVT